MKRRAVPPVHRPVPDTVERLRGIRDLPDFHLNWSHLRQTAVSLPERHSFSTEDRALLEWLIRMADRIGERDIEPKASG